MVDRKSTHIPEIATATEGDFLFDRVDPRLNGEGRSLPNVGVVILGAELKGRLDPRILGTKRRGLQTTGDGSPVRPYFLQVDGGGHHFDIVEAKLRTLGHFVGVRIFFEDLYRNYSAYRCRRSLKRCQYQASFYTLKCVESCNEPMIMAQPSKYKRSPLPRLANQHDRATRHLTYSQPC